MHIWEYVGVGGGLNLKSSLDEQFAKNQKKLQYDTLIINWIGGVSLCPF